MKRLPEIDALRGIAIIMMIAFHILYDLNYFTSTGINLDSGAGMLLGRATATMFLGIVGISLTLSYSRIKSAFSKLKIYKKFIKRGTTIFAIGLLITAITYFLFPQYYVHLLSR